MAAYGLSRTSGKFFSVFIHKTVQETIIMSDNMKQGAQQSTQQNNKHPQQNSEQAGQNQQNKNRGQENPAVGSERERGKDYANVGGNKR